MHGVTTSELGNRQQNWKVALCLAVLLLVVAGAFVHPVGEQQASRYAFTAALWDGKTVVLDDYTEILGRDYAFKDGVVYSDKAPGQPFLAVPFLALYRIVDSETAVPGSSQPEHVVWWLTLWSATIPAAILVVLMYRWAKDVEPDTALIATITLAFGSLLLVYSTLLFGHVLAACLAFAMFILIRDRAATGRQLLAAGVVGGLAVIVEYPLALVVAILVGAAVRLHRVRAWRLIVGGLPAVALLGWYNWTAFGSPLLFSYQFSGFLEEPRAATEIFPGPSFSLFVDVLFSPRGLFVAAPVLVLAVLGLLRMGRTQFRFDAIVAGLAFVAMLMVQVSWSNPYAGGAGPRYVTPGLPFLVAPMAVAWKRWQVPARVLAAISIGTMVLATVTDPQLSSSFQAGLRHWVEELLAGHLAPTVWTLLAGGMGWLIHVATIAAVGLVLWRVSSDARTAEEPLPPSALSVREPVS